METVAGVHHSLGIINPFPNFKQLLAAGWPAGHRSERAGILFQGRRKENKLAGAERVDHGIEVFRNFNNAGFAVETEAVCWYGLAQDFGSDGVGPQMTPPARRRGIAQGHTVGAARVIGR